MGRAQLTKLPTPSSDGSLNHDYFCLFLPTKKKKKKPKLQLDTSLSLTRDTGISNVVLSSPQTRSKLATFYIFFFHVFSLSRKVSSPREAKPTMLTLENSQDRSFSLPWALSQTSSVSHPDPSQPCSCQQGVCITYTTADGKTLGDRVIAYACEEGWATYLPTQIVPCIISSCLGLCFSASMIKTRQMTRILVS